MWKNFSLSQRSVAFTLAALATWFLRVKPLCAVFFLTFLFWSLKAIYNLDIVPPPEFYDKCEEMFITLSHIRLTKPKFFCVISSTCFLMTAVVGHFISGTTFILIGLGIAAYASSKFNFKLVGEYRKDYRYTKKLNVEKEPDDEFMPEVNERNLFLLENASNLATISSPIEDTEEDEDKSDEIPSELLIPDVIPEIDENSTDDNDEDILVPNNNDVDKSNAIKTIENDLNKTPTKIDLIEFKKGHFKRDSSFSTSSSSSEESLSKGLKFPDHTTVDGLGNLPQLTSRTTTTTTTEATAAAAVVAAAAATITTNLPYSQEAANIVTTAVKTQTQALLASSSKLLPNFMSGIVQWGMGESNSSSSSGSGVAGGGGGGGSTINDGGGASNSGVQHGSRLTQRRVTALDSSDDSDFEILENEDFK